MDQLRTRLTKFRHVDTNKNKNQDLATGNQKKMKPRPQLGEGNIDSDPDNRNLKTSRNLETGNQTCSCQCTSQLNIFSTEFKLLLAQIEVISQWIRTNFGIKLFDRESLVLHYNQDFCEIQEIAQLLTTTVSFENSNSIESNSCNENEQEIDFDNYDTKPSTRSTRSCTSKSKLTAANKQKHGLPRQANRNRNVATTKTVEQDNAENPKEFPPPPVKEEVTSEVDLVDLDDFTDIHVADADSDCKSSLPDADTNDPDFEIEERAARSSLNSKTKSKSRRFVKRRKKADNSHSNKPNTQGQSSNAKGPGQCDECGLIMSNASNLKEHKKIHSDTRDYKCDICSKTFIRSYNLREHYVLHLGEEAKILKCSFCEKSFLHSRDLDVHERTHTGEKPYMCHICPKSFNVKQHLTYHIRTHTGEKPCLCTGCNRAFSQPNCLRIHKKTCKGVPLTPREKKRIKGRSKVNNLLLQMAGSSNSVKSFIRGLGDGSTTMGEGKGEAIQNQSESSVLDSSSNLNLPVISEPRENNPWENLYSVPGPNPNLVRAPSPGSVPGPSPASVPVPLFPMESAMAGLHQYIPNNNNINQ